MARPIKNNADYFPHDADMRNDDRVKAIRRKFKHLGYSIWNMLIEYLTGREFFEFEYTDLNLELIAGDFDAEVQDVQNVISYCLTLGLLQQEDGFIRCKTLVKRLDPVLQKRKRFSSGVSAPEMPQSKVKKSKVKKSKEEKSIKPLRAYEIPFPVESQEYKLWLEWEEHRKQKGSKITPVSAKKQFAFLGARAGPEVCAILDQSIQQGWTGLFELKKQNGNVRTANKRTPDAVINGRHEGFGTFN